MKKEQISLELEAASVEYNGYIYFSEPKLNGLCRLELTSGKIEFLLFFDKEKKKSEVHRNAFRYKNEAWFIPWEGEYILCINLDTLETQYYEVPYSKLNYRGMNTSPYTTYYSAGRINEEKIFLIPAANDTPVVINMREKRIKAFFGTFDVDNEVMGYGVSIDGKIWMTPIYGERIVILDEVTGEVSELPWKFEDLDYAGMLYYDKKIWFSPYKADNILRYDLERDSYEKIPLKEQYNEKYHYWELKYYQDKIWIIPQWGNKILYYDLRCANVACIQKDQEICIEYLTELRQIESDEEFMLVTCRTGYLSIYQPDKNCFKNIPVKIELEQLHEMMRSLSDKAFIENFLEEGIAYEKYLGLENYIRLIDKKTESIQEKEDIGEKIWKSIFENSGEKNYV